MDRDTLLFGGLTLFNEALIIKAWTLPADWMLMISGGSVGYRRTLKPFKTSIRSTLTSIIHAIRPCSAQFL